MRSVALFGGLLSAVIAGGAVGGWILESFRYGIAGEVAPVRHVVFGALKWLYFAAALVISIRIVTAFWREHRIRSLRYDRTDGMLQFSYNGLPMREFEAGSIERLTVRPLRTYNLRTLQIEEPHRTTEVLCVWYVFDRSFLSDRILSDLGQLLADAIGVPFKASAEIESTASSEADG